MRPFFIPQPISTILSRLPQYPHSLIFSRAINLALGAKRLDPVWQPLHGKQVSVRVRDAGITFYFTFGQNGLVARQASVAQPDLSISASAQDFLLLALRKEDPDTLFFSRRLVMEGDTELGLLVKNTLDSMELPPLDFSSLLPAHVFGKLRMRLLT